MVAVATTVYFSLVKWNKFIIPNIVHIYKKKSELRQFYIMKRYPVTKLLHPNIELLSSDKL